MDALEIEHRAARIRKHAHELKQDLFASVFPEDAQLEAICAFLALIDASATRTLTDDELTLRDSLRALWSQVQAININVGALLSDPNADETQGWP